MLGHPDFGLTDKGHFTNRGRRLIPRGLRRVTDAHEGNKTRVEKGGRNAGKATPEPSSSGECSCQYSPIKARFGKGFPSSGQSQG